MQDKDDKKITPVARMRSDLGSKFGIPRQSGIVDELVSTVVFEEGFRDPSCLRGLEGFSHIWLIWGFSESPEGKWSATVRPPRLGGNERRGVFATRSPFRPNGLGLSCVEIESIELAGPDGPVIRVRGADLLDGTPIYDVKPYVPYTDLREGALSGFSASGEGSLSVRIGEDLAGIVGEERLPALKGILSCDPRPAYQDDPERIYGLTFAGLQVRFTVDGGVLTVVSVSPADAQND